MRTRRLLRVAVAGVVSSFVGTATAGAQAVGDLFAVDRVGGTLYRVSSANASAVGVGTVTGAPGELGSLEMGPDGSLYGFSLASDAQLVRINPHTAAGTVVGSLGIGFVFEGGLAFAPDGTAHAVNQNDADSPRLFTIDLATGAATVGAVISGGTHDINGLAWRADGKLVGLDRVSNALLQIDPATGASSVIAPVLTTVGPAGGMAVLDGVGYFAANDNELWRLDLFTGAHSRVGVVTAMARIGGLAAIPEPAMAAVLCTGAAITFARRPRRGRFASIRGSGTCP